MKNLHPNALIALIQICEDFYPDEPLHPNPIVALRQIRNAQKKERQA